MNLEEWETELVGGWIFKDGRMLDDETSLRIRALIDHRLIKLAVSQDGWETLFQDPRGGRYWERTFPRSEMHGGGPQTLRLIEPVDARKKYGIALG